MRQSTNLRVGERTSRAPSPQPCRADGGRRFTVKLKPTFVERPRSQPVAG